MWYFSIFRKMSWKFKFNCNLTRITSALNEDQYTFFSSYVTHLFLEWEMFQTKILEKIKTHILCSVPFYVQCLLCSVPFYVQWLFMFNAFYVQCLFMFSAFFPKILPFMW
jgi:hypothetical protein